MAVIILEAHYRKKDRKKERAYISLGFWLDAMAFPSFPNVKFYGILP
jgi:hypothetical protein